MRTSVCLGTLSAAVEIDLGELGRIGAGGEGVEAVAQRYRDAGLTDVEVHLYPEARHEILNETNRDEVTADIVAWLRAHAG